MALNPFANMVAFTTNTFTVVTGDSAPADWSTAVGKYYKRSDAGTYTATASTSNTNYAVSNYQTTFTIKKAKISVHWNGTNASYDGTAKSPTPVAQGVNGKALSFTLTFKYSGQTVSSAVQAGVYTVTATLTNSADQNNYELENATLTNFVITA